MNLTSQLIIIYKKIKSQDVIKVSYQLMLNLQKRLAPGWAINRVEEQLKERLGAFLERAFPAGLEEAARP